LGVLEQLIRGCLVERRRHPSEPVR
jgi:hypothetical protein